MARSNVFIFAGNEHRDVTIGGRRNPSTGYARINTDNGGKSDCSMSLHAEVVGEKQRGGAPRKTCDCGYHWVEGHYVQPDGTEGYIHGGQNEWVPGDDGLDKCPKCGRARQGVDTRKSVFTVELPDQTGEHVEVVIREHGYRLADLARFGAALCATKGIIEQVQGEETGDTEKVKQGKWTVKKAVEIVTELEAETGKNIPNVVLPGGVTLAHALACVEVCRRMAEGRRSKN